MQLSSQTSVLGNGRGLVELRPRATLEPMWSVTMRHTERLGGLNRLRSTRDFTATKSAGRPLRGRLCLLLVLARPGESTRVGFIASKKGVGGAVQRNRARRRLREIVRRRWPRIPSTGYFLAFIASRTTLTATHQDLASEVERLLAEAGAIAPLTRSTH